MEDKQRELQSLEAECEAVLEDLRSQQIEVEGQRQQTEEESNILEEQLQQILEDEAWQDKLEQEDQNQSGNSGSNGSSGNDGGSGGDTVAIMKRALRLLALPRLCVHLLLLG